jgi:hypothetical protein
MAVVRFPIDRSNNRGHCRYGAEPLCGATRIVAEQSATARTSFPVPARIKQLLWSSFGPGVTISWSLILLRLGGKPLQVPEPGVTYPLIHRYAQGLKPCFAATWSVTDAQKFGKI